MNILFIVPTYKPAYVYGGATEAISLLAESLVTCGHEVTVYTTNGNGKTELEIETGKEILVDGVKVFYFKRYTRDHSHLAPGFLAKVLFNVRKFDVVHLHSWWNPPIVMAAAICKLSGVKPILSPHGMFCDYVLYEHNKRKKQILHYFTKRLLLNSFLHVSSEMEWDESQSFIKESWPGKILPNLVNADSNVVASRSESENEPFVIGFISRIDPKKGLDILIKALSKVNFSYKLKIAGTGEPDYIQYLNQVALKQGNSEHIEWVGWKDKIQKFLFYSSIDLFALTSLNENFAVVVIESLSVGTPVFLSDKVGLSKYVKERKLGWVTAITDVNGVATQLNAVYLQKQMRRTIKERAPQIIKKDFDTTLLANKYADYYKSICNQQVSETMQLVKL